MKNYDVVKKIFYWFFLVLLVIANVYLFLDLQNNVFLDHYLCDGGSSDDNVHSLDGNNDANLSESLSIYSRFKCQVSWWLTEKKDRPYSSYSDYKAHWDSSVGLRDIIKADFNRTKFSIHQSNIKNRVDSENLMRDISTSRNQSSADKANRFYQMFSNKK